MLRDNDLPRELNKVTMPAYRIEPPDILVINAVRVIPRPPYRIEPFDELMLQCPPATRFPPSRSAASTRSGPTGQVDLRYSYGKVAVAGLTPEQARMPSRSTWPTCTASNRPRRGGPVRPTACSRFAREHLVRMDGTVDLGVYGEVYVAGLTLAEARLAVEAQLTTKLVNPEATVDVQAYNSKFYYVIYDGDCAGQVPEAAFCRRETVLEPSTELRALPIGTATTGRIWIARPVPGEACHRQILPVDWAAITEAGAARTNHQLFPGDRVYVRAESSAFHRGHVQAGGAVRAILRIHFTGSGTLVTRADREHGR